MPPFGGRKWADSADFRNSVRETVVSHLARHKALSKGVRNTRELVEPAGKTQAEAFAMPGKRLTTKR